MKGKKCFGLLLLCSIMFGASLAVSLDASAFTFGGVNQTAITNPTFSGTNANGDPFSASAYTSLGGMWTYFIPQDQNPGLGNTRITMMVAPTQSSSLDIPANTLFTFKMRYVGLDAIPIGGEPGGASWALLNYNCTSGYSGTEINYTCTYWGYTPNRLSSVILVNTLGIYPPTTTHNRLVAIDQYFNYVQIVTESGGGSSGLTQQDKDFLAQQISAVSSNVSSNTSVLNQIKLLIQSQGESQQETLENIEEAITQQNQQDAEDRENIEEQQGDISDAGDDSASDATSTGTTLLGAFSGFVSALSNVSPSNCLIDMDMGNLDLGLVDFCTLSPPQPIPTIASILLIMFCVPLSIATARKVINLFRSFQS